MNAKTQVAEAPADLTGTQLITLDPDKYVAAVFAPFRERLDTAKAAAKDIKAEVATKEGMLVAIKQRAIFRSLRIEIESARKLRKAPITEIGKKLDGRAHELTDECTPDEERFDVAIKAEETRKERERAEKEAAELARVTAIQAKIAEFVNLPGTFVGKSSETIEAAIRHMETQRDCGLWAQEFKATAEDAHSKAVAAMQQLHAGALATEKAAAEEAARVKAERAELARLRAEADERARHEQARIAEETRKRAEEAAAARAKIEAEERASREKIEAENRKAREIREEADRVAREALAAQHARLTAEREAEDRARAEKDAQERYAQAQREAEFARQAAERAEKEAALRAEQERLDAEKREIARRQEEVLAIDRLIGVLRDRIKGEKRYAGIAKAIEAWYARQQEQAA